MSLAGEAIPGQPPAGAGPVGGALRIHRALAVNGALALFVWGLWLALGGERALQALVANWPVTLTMAFGSMVAGATAEGGGAVAFPVFTKILGIPAPEARVFALAIQSVGMTAASIVILALRVPFEGRALLAAAPAGILGLVLGTYLLVPMVPVPVLRLSFTLLVATLGIALVIMNRPGFTARNLRIPRFGPPEAALLAGAGFLGGLVVSLLGTGIDILIFMPLVLLFRLSEKVATPTTVLLMTSLTLPGFALHALNLGTFTPTVQDYWLAAVPVVVLGAPVGAIICALMSRRSIALVLIVLILLETISTLILIPISPQIALWAGVTLLVGGALNLLMCRSRTYHPSGMGRPPIQRTVPQVSPG